MLLAVQALLFDGDEKAPIAHQGGGSVVPDVDSEMKTSGEFRIP
jgi:hypothetical protein